MTVPTTINRKEYNGNGATTAFPYPYPFLADADLVVLLVDANGVATTWVLNTQYTVSGAGTANSGQVTVKTSPTNYTPAVGTKLIIYRDPAMTQSTDFVNNSALDAEVLEQALDKQTMIAQRTRELTARSMRLADSDTSGASVVLPVPTASRLLGWNSAGDALENFTPNSSTYLAVSAFALTLLDDTTATAARTTLGALAADGDGSGLSGILPSSAGMIAPTDNHTLTAADNGKIVFMNKGSAVTLTCPQDSTENLAAGFQVAVVNFGAGQVTVAKEGSDNLRVPANKAAKLRAQHSWGAVVKKASTEWLVTGDLEDA